MLGIMCTKRRGIRCRHAERGAPLEAQAQPQRLERRVVGLPTAISTVFGLIVATTVLVSVGQGFAASWIFLVALAIGLLLMYMQALPSIHFQMATLSGLLGLAVFTFVGLEYACPLAEELDDPSRDLPKGMFLGLALIAVPLVLYGLAATRYLPAAKLGDPTQLTH